MVSQALPSGSNRRSSRRWYAPWGPYALVALLAIVVYLPSARYGFIGYDDTLLIVDNREFLSRISNAPQAFLQDAFHVPGYESSGAYYRPVVTLSLMFDAQIGGVSPWIYHATNIAAHAAGSCAVVAFLAALGYPLAASFLLGLVFAAHPVLVSAVAWVPGRVESLVALFTLLAGASAIRYARAGGRRFAALHFAMFALALFTKEVALFLPVPLLVFLHGLRAEAPVRRRRWVLAAGWAVVLAVWVSLRGAALSAPALPALLLGQVMANLPVLVHYLGKTLVPAGLSVAPAGQGVALYTGLVALLVLILALLRSRNRRRGMIVLGAAWYLAFTLPPLLVPRIVGLEQRVYLPMAGLFVLALEGGLRQTLGRSRLAFGIVLGVALVFAGVTVARVPIYSSRQAFWENAVATSPGSSYARASLGAVYLSRDRLDEAREQYARALELNPGEPKANNNLGVIAGRQGKVAEAERFFRREVEVNPRYADAWFNLAMMRLQAGDTASAAASWRRTVELQPGHRHALGLLARHYAMLGQAERAAEYGRRAGMSASGAPSSGSAPAAPR